MYSAVSHNIWSAIVRAVNPMKGIINNLIRTGFMTEEQKILLAWNDLEIAASRRDLKKVFKLAYYIRSIVKEYEKELQGQLPTIDL